MTDNTKIEDNENCISAMKLIDSMVKTQQTAGDCWQIDYDFIIKLRNCIEEDISKEKRSAIKSAAENFTGLTRVRLRLLAEEYRDDQ